jgi:hypothetical protein
MEIQKIVDDKIKEMYYYKDTQGTSIVMKQVRDTPGVPMSIKVELVQKLALAKDKIEGKYVSAGELMRPAKHMSKGRKVSYRAKYTGNFSGGAAGSARTTRK